MFERRGVMYSILELEGFALLILPDTIDLNLDMNTSRFLDI